MVFDRVDDLVFGRDLEILNPKKLRQLPYTNDDSNKLRKDLSSENVMEVKALLFVIFRGEVIESFNEKS
ncbi:MAG: hypothetical protein JSR97_02055 [Verrucomicrobia bacterium]|nr:hypothetical protein [Verrucomicrobiota bacterium]